MTQGRSVVKSTLWSVLESGSVSLLSLVSLVLFAKLLTPSDFGAFAIALSVVEVVGLITGMLLHDALIQAKDADDRLFASAFCGTAIISALAVIALYFVFPLLADWAEDSRVSDVGRVLSVSILFSSPANILAARLKRELNFRALAMRSMLGRVFGLVLGLLLAWRGGGVWALVVQYLLMTVAGAAFLGLAFRHYVSLTLDLRRVFTLFPFALDSILSYFFGFSAKRVFTFLLGVTIGTHEAGLLNLAFRIADTLWAITANAVSQVMLPMMSRKQDDPEVLVTGFRQSVEMSAFVLFPVFVGLGAISPELVRVVFGEQWGAASGYVTALSFMIFAQIPRVYCVPLLNSSGSVRSVRNANIALMLVVCVVFLAFPVKSAWVGVLAWFGFEILLFALLAGSVRRKFALDIRSILKPMAGSVAGASIMFGIVRGVSGWIELPGALKLVFLIVLGAMVFVGYSCAFERARLLSVWVALSGLVKKKRNAA